MSSRGGLIFLGVVALLIWAAGRTPSEPPSTPTSVQSSTPAPAVEIDAVAREPAAFPSTNEEKGCVMLIDVIGTYEPEIEKECRGIIPKFKGTSDVSPCVFSGMAMRMAVRKEPPTARPPGVQLVVWKACSMMIWGRSEQQTEKIIDGLCAKSHDPQLVSDCRGAGYIR